MSLGISVNPGNSGGPLVDDGERILGVVVARGDPKQGVEGIGYAVPLDRPLLVLASVLDRHARAHATLDSLDEAEKSFARVVGHLVESEGVNGMLDEAARAIEHLKARS